MFHSNTESRSAMLLRQLLLALLFGGLLAMAFLDNDYFYLTWVAFVPLLIAIEGTSLARTYLIGLIAGLSLFTSGTYWIADFISISKGYSFSSSLLLALVVWFYCAHFVAFLVLMFRWLARHSIIHEFLLFPVVVVSFTSAYPMLFAMRLGESQIKFYSAIQGAEYAGVHGVDAIIALFNIVIFRSFYRRFSGSLLSRSGSKLPWIFAAALIAIWFGYGVTSYSMWENKIKNWGQLKIGIVQPNEIPSLSKQAVYPGFSNAYPPEMEMSERLSNVGAEVLIWPEAQPKNYLNNSNIRTAYQENIKSLGSSLLFQDMEQIRDPINGKLKTQYNTAILLGTDGQHTGEYRKIKRIPFGEYVPMVSDSSSTRKLVEGFFGEFLNEVSPGEPAEVFTHERVNIIPLICYETTFPSFVANAVNSTASRINKSNGSLLVGLSNDGWFGSTHQPYQHIVASVLRAVENRLPLVHAANNGPSIVVSPSGKIEYMTDFQQAGGYLVNIPLSSQAQGSFYSRHPKLFDSLIYLMLIVSVLSAIWNKFNHKERTPF